jgi:hypothetical protein
VKTRTKVIIGTPVAACGIRDGFGSSSPRPIQQVPVRRRSAVRSGPSTYRCSRWSILKRTRFGKPRPLGIQVPAQIAAK